MPVPYTPGTLARMTAKLRLRIAMANVLDYCGVRIQAYAYAAGIRLSDSGQTLRNLADRIDPIQINVVRSDAWQMICSQPQPLRLVK